MAKGSRTWLQQQIRVTSVAYGSTARSRFPPMERASPTRSAVRVPWWSS
ncbi:hypothetical protein ACFPRL_17590 [Pseudoclavibacter helvolus]